MYKNILSSLSSIINQIMKVYNFESGSPSLNGMLLEISRTVPLTFEIVYDILRIWWILKKIFNLKKLYLELFLTQQTYNFQLKRIW